MLLMDILTWKPARAEEIIKHKGEEKIPEGIKIIGEWIDLGGNRAFRLVEVPDPKLLFAMTSFWIGFGKKELVPVMTTEDMMKLMPGG